MIPRRRWRKMILLTWIWSANLTISRTIRSNLTQNRMRNSLLWTLIKWTWILSKFNSIRREGNPRDAKLMRKLHWRERRMILVIKWMLKKTSDCSPLMLELHLLFEIKLIYTPLIHYKSSLRYARYSTLSSLRYVLW